MDRTLKLRAFKEDSKKDGSKDHRDAGLIQSQELAKKDALLDEERNKSNELLKSILQLRESLKQEQSKTNELKSRLNRLDGVEQNQLIKKNALLEEEQKNHLVQIKVNEQLRESLKYEQVNLAEMTKKTAELQAKLRKLDVVEENQLIKKDAQLEEEKKKTLECMKTIEQLKASIKHDLGKKNESEKKLLVLENKVKELSVVLSKIATLAAGGKLGNGV